MLSEISQTEKKNAIWYHLYVDSKKKYIKLVNKPKKKKKKEQAHRYREQISSYL